MFFFSLVGCFCANSFGLFFRFLSFDYSALVTRVYGLLPLPPTGLLLLLLLPKVSLTNEIYRGAFLFLLVLRLGNANLHHVNVWVRVYGRLGNR